MCGLAPMATTQGTNALMPLMCARAAYNAGVLPTAAARPRCMRQRRKFSIGAIVVLHAGAGIRRVQSAWFMSACCGKGVPQT